MTRYFFASALLFIALPAVAVPASEPNPPATALPLYDVDAYCAHTYATNEDVKNMCIHQEQDNYNYLKNVWPSASQKIKTECLNILANINPTAQEAYGATPTYTLLAGCIGPRLELERATMPQSFHP
jgi:hypothetical protein